MPYLARRIETQVAFGIFRGKVWQRKENGRKWRARVFDADLPEVYDTKSSALAGLRIFATEALRQSLCDLENRSSLCGF